MQSILDFCRSVKLDEHLKQNIGEYNLVVDDRLEDNTYHWFHYVNNREWQFKIIYDADVEDFTAKIMLPLNSFNCIDFIKPTGEVFWDNFLLRYEKFVQNNLINPENSLNYQYRQKGINSWDYQSFLPDSIGDFRLDIKPTQGIKMINGSYIIASYVHIAKKTGLNLCYNIMRDDFYAELCKDGTPIITHELDARTISELEYNLKDNLKKILQELS